MLTQLKLQHSVDVWHAAAVPPQVASDDSQRFVAWLQMLEQHCPLSVQSSSYALHRGGEPPPPFVFVPALEVSPPFELAEAPPLVSAPLAPALFLSPLSAPVPADASLAPASPADAAMAPLPAPPACVPAANPPPRPSEPPEPEPIPFA